MSLHQGRETAPTECNHGYCSDGLRGLEQPIRVISLTVGLQHRFHLIRQPDMHRPNPKVWHTLQKLEPQALIEHSWDFKRYSPARNKSTLNLQPLTFWTINFCLKQLQYLLLYPVVFSFTMPFSISDLLPHSSKNIY